MTSKHGIGDVLSMQDHGVIQKHLPLRHTHSGCRTGTL